MRGHPRLHLSRGTAVYVYYPQKHYSIRLLTMNRSLKPLRYTFVLLRLCIYHPIPTMSLVTSPDNVGLYARMHVGRLWLVFCHDARTLNPMQKERYNVYV